MVALVGTVVVHDQVDLLIGEIKEKKTNLKIDLHALKERLSVEFSINIEDLIHGQESTASGAGEEAVAKPGEKVSEDDLREKTAKLKKQLDEFGSINPMAMEAYQEIHLFFAAALLLDRFLCFIYFSAGGIIVLLDFPESLFQGFFLCIHCQQVFVGMIDMFQCFRHFLVNCLQLGVVAGDPFFQCITLALPVFQVLVNP